MEFSRELFDSFINGNQAWWVYAITILIPLCIMVAIREVACWFWKFNAMTARLGRIERLLAENLEESRKLNRSQINHSTDYHISSDEPKKVGPTEP